MQKMLIDNNPSVIISHLDALSRLRALTDAESKSLERAIKEEMRLSSVLGQRTLGFRPWTATEDQNLLTMVREGKTFRQAGEALDRSLASCSSRFQRLMGRKP
jgi:hypothetical protein